MKRTEEHVRRIRDLFRGEASEHFRAIERAVADAAAEPERSSEHLEGALRAAHSLKGIATIAGAATVSALVHNWESCVAALLAGSSPLDAETASLLFLALDHTFAEMEVFLGDRSTLGADARHATESLRDRFAGRC